MMELPFLLLVLLAFIVVGSTTKARSHGLIRTSEARIWLMIALIFSVATFCLALIQLFIYKAM